MMMLASKVRDQELQTLKTLLLSDEHRELLELRAAVQTLSKRVGSNEAMQATVCMVLSEALEQVSKENPSALSRTLAPLVMDSVRRQIKSSADDVIEIMYPLTGRMIAASVKNAINTLSERINREIEARFPLKTSLLTLRAKIFGLPAADLILAASEAASIQRIMILAKSSGDPIQIWPDRAEDENPRENAELVTGMLAALNGLAEEAFDATAGNLRTVELDGRQIALRSSASHLLILEVSGRLKSADEIKIDQFFADWVEGMNSHARPISPAALEELAHRIGSQPIKEKESHKQKQDQPKGLMKTLFLFGLIATVLAWPAWRVIEKRSLDADARRISQAILADQDLMGFPLQVQTDYDSRSIVVTGLLPHGIDLRERRLSWLKATEYRPIQTNVRYVLAAPLPPSQW